MPAPWRLAPTRDTPPIAETKPWKTAGSRTERDAVEREAVQTRAQAAADAKAYAERMAEMKRKMKKRTLLTPRESDAETKPRPAPDEEP